MGTALPSDQRYTNGFQKITQVSYCEMEPNLDMCLHIRRGRHLLILRWLPQRSKWLKIDWNLIKNIGFQMITQVSLLSIGIKLEYMFCILGETEAYWFWCLNLKGQGQSNWIKTEIWWKYWYADDNSSILLLNGIKLGYKCRGRNLLFLRSLPPRSRSVLKFDENIGIRMLTQVSFNLH